MKDAEQIRMHRVKYGQRPEARLWNPETLQYLHFSGKGETQISAYSWVGFIYQADELERRAKVRGEPWPYIIRWPERWDERPDARQ